ncbi:uncharacterized protein FIBRA_08065 [Fibroporia radiculosa]|uniref:Mitochondrial glyco protein n=1 Tax=Fibroporia radiculosa TaxID=599839 RepID=J4H4Z1_9APHY|nr:uncharacterized protein FIBRA_08065 [Fibroporia radiculosa]CCM05829.1 predicted protein [Fibroporia radiculosa]
MSAIRALRQVSLVSTRALAVRSAPRSLSRAAMPVFAVRAAPACAARAFSLSARTLGEGASDVALSQKLTEEMQYEKEAATEAEPDFLRSFKAQGVWAIEDVAGNDEVALTRKFGNESIRMMFSIADINQSETQFENEEETDGSDEEPNHSYPIRCSLSVTKSAANGALTVDVICQEGTFVVENISFYKDAQVGTELTAEADWRRRGLYIGPQFDTLDVSVQEEFEKFLQERGINEALASFVPEYAEYKEQKVRSLVILLLELFLIGFTLQEYVSWLQNVKTFVEA